MSKEWRERGRGKRGGGKEGERGGRERKLPFVLFYSAYFINSAVVLTEG